MVENRQMDGLLDTEAAGLSTELFILGGVEWIGTEAVLSPGLASEDFVFMRIKSWKSYLGVWSAQPAQQSVPLQLLPEGQPPAPVQAEKEKLYFKDGGNPFGTQNEPERELTS